MCISWCFCSICRSSRRAQPALIIFVHIAITPWTVTQWRIQVVRVRTKKPRRQKTTSSRNNNKTHNCHAAKMLSIYCWFSEMILPWYCARLIGLLSAFIETHRECAAMSSTHMHKAPLFLLPSPPSRLYNVYACDSCHWIISLVNEGKWMLE